MTMLLLSNLHHAKCAARRLGAAICASFVLGHAAFAGNIIAIPETGMPTETTDFGSEQMAARVDSGRRVHEDDRAAQSMTWVSPLRLIDMHNTGRDAVLRVTGERELVKFDLYVGDPAQHQTLQLSTVSSINLLPERSRMRVSVNGYELGAASLRNFEGFGDDQFAIPAGVLMAGRNKVQVEFRQGHRIFCGPDASFDLWTDLDLRRSGIEVARNDADVGINAFMMALAAQGVGARAVEIRGADHMGTQAAAWREFLVTRLNQVLVGTPVAFTFADYFTLAQPEPDLARITIIPSTQNRVTFQRGGDGAHVMVIHATETAQPHDILGDLPQFAPQPVSERPPLILPERDVPFAEMGIPTQSLSQRYAVLNFPFRLPDDWLVLTAAKARINLDYFYVEGLPRNATLLLMMNGVSIRLLPLRDEGGRPIVQFPIDFEARLMQPGTNALTFELLIPGDPADLPCPAILEPLLTISDTSSLHVPFSPSMAIADMELAFAALSPESIALSDLSARAFTDEDILILSAALARSRADMRPSRLHLMSIDDLSSIPSGHHRANRRLLEDTVLITPDMEQLLADSATGSTGDPFAARRIDQRGVSLAFSSGWAMVTNTLTWLRDRIFPTSGDQLNQWLAMQRGQAIFFQLDPTRPDEIWMLRSPGSDMHAIAHSIAAVRAFGRGPRGQVSILGHDGIWDNWIAPDRRPILLEPLSLQNYRHALGNFVSARPIFYTLLMLVLAVGSALVALRLVVSTRESGS